MYGLQILTNFDRNKLIIECTCTNVYALLLARLRAGAGGMQN